jgi:PAS domain-containing protein
MARAGGGGGSALLRWQALRHRRARARAQEEHNRALQQQQEEIHRQFQSRQQALFNSMSEGILLLDRHGRVRMMNESLRKFFDVTADVRGQTIMEAFRWHELAALAAKLQREKHHFRRRIGNPARAPPLLAGQRRHRHRPARRRRGAVVCFSTKSPASRNWKTSAPNSSATSATNCARPLSLIKGSAETLLDGAIHDPQASHPLFAENRQAFGPAFVFD